MIKVTIELSDKDAEWLKSHQQQIAWIAKHKFTHYAEGTERRVIDKIAKTLVKKN